jgi:hypothetical protein
MNDPIEPSKPLRINESPIWSIENNLDELNDSIGNEWMLTTIKKQKYNMKSNLSLDIQLKLSLQQGNLNTKDTHELYLISIEKYLNHQSKPKKTMKNITRKLGSPPWFHKINDHKKLVESYDPLHPYAPTPVTNTKYKLNVPNMIVPQIQEKQEKKENIEIRQNEDSNKQDTKEIVEIKQNESSSKSSEQTIENTTEINEHDHENDEFLHINTDNIDQDDEQQLLEQTLLNMKNKRENDNDNDTDTDNEEEDIIIEQTTTVTPSISSIQPRSHNSSTSTLVGKKKNPVIRNVRSIGAFGYSERDCMSTKIPEVRKKKNEYNNYFFFICIDRYILINNIID